MTEVIVFASFLSIQVLAHKLPEWIEHTRCKRIAEKLSRNHYLVWAAHPAVLHGIHEYAVHLVVYSGYVIRAH
jgi:uncharacterized membrane protein